MTTSVTATRISDCAIIDAPPELVWKVLRGFSAVAQWHPAVENCIIEGGGPADRVGTVRAIHLRDGTPCASVLLRFPTKI